jgi:hypothetical protein
MLLTQGDADKGGKRRQQWEGKADRTPTEGETSDRTDGDAANRWRCRRLREMPPTQGDAADSEATKHRESRQQRKDKINAT